VWVTLAFVSTAVLFVGWALTTLRHQRWARRLPALEALSAPAGLDELRTSAVRCSVIVAVRDEEARLEGTVRHLLAQRHVALEVIVVDDRSTDATGDILRLLASEDTRVRVTRVERLPDGWLGKSHACHVGASVAKGDWLLFTDGDCWLKPDVIARALRVAARDGADHITLTPGVAAETLGAQAWQLAFLGSLATWMSGVNRDRPGAYLGIGAFNLVRASAYRACGGYEALRLTILDDIKLGLLLHRAGSRTRAFLGGPDVECHWGTTVPHMIRIMEKNYFAAVDFRLGPVVAGAILIALMVGTSIIGLWTQTAAGIAAGLAPWSLVFPAAVFARRLGWSPASAALTPLMYPILFFAVVNSAVVTLRQGGVRWRDTFYSLDALRRGNVR
jgi:cellulose synthase/poly-beta-1,6-N-acetylglucosamine synthase-like glycosyltransferase